VIHERIATDPTIADGAPIIRGTRVPVHQILNHAAAGKTLEEILVELPELELADVQAALAYAATVTRHQAQGELDPLQTVSALQPLDEVQSGAEPAELDLSKILVVDDQEINRLYMQAMFRDSEFTLSVASDGVEALAKAQSELPFLVLTDIQMPNMDGFELCRQLKADGRTKSAAVIFVTAHHRSSQKVVEGLDIGADDYVFRPFARGELMSRVKAVARLKRAEEEARRQAQTVARRNKELELLNELAVAVTSSLDLEEIFALSMAKLSQLLNAEAVSLLLLEPEAQRLVVNVASRYGERVSSSVSLDHEEEVTDRVIQERAPLFIGGVLNEHGPDLKIDLAFDAYSVTCVPMTSKEQIVGAVAIICKQGENLTTTDRVLLNSAAGIVAVAVENARLLQRVQQQVSDLALLNEIGHALTSTLDLEQILRSTTQMVQEALRAEATSLWLLDEECHELVLTASSGSSAQLEPGSCMSIHTSIAGHVVETGEPYFSADVASEAEQHNHLIEISDCPSGSIMCVPVRAKDQIIGVVRALHRRSHWFDQTDLRLLYSVASSVGIAIENARLFGEVQEFNRRLERKVAERTRELAEEKEKTEAILASMADGLLVLDAENHILTANTVAEGMLDFRLSEARGQPIREERLANPLWRCINGMVERGAFTPSASIDLPDPTQLGGVLSIQALAARVREESGQVIGTVIALRDITAIKAVERMKARFMAGITHELKTPLAVIRLYANNLRAYHTRLSEEKQGELFIGIQTQVKLLEQLLEDILELSRLDAGEAKGERQPVNVVELADELVADLLPLAKSRLVTLLWEKPATAITVLAEKNQMKRMIRNLVDNAIKYTSAGGSVGLKLASKSKNTVTIQVTDTGIGISPEQQSRIFDRFYRVDPSHNIPGTGLGLSIVKEIVTTHGGDIRVESKLGVGSTFVVTLPGVERSVVR
jgi:two-component system phosphate regulon sensor histidine kinase PhoR